MLTQLRMALTLLDSSTKWQAVFLGFLILVSSGLEALSVGMVFPLIKMISNPESITTMPIVSTVYEMLGEPAANDFLVISVLGLLGVFLFKNSVMAFVVYNQNKFAFENEAILSKQLFSGYLYTPYALAVQRNSADLIRNAADSVFVVFNNVIIPAINVLTETFVLIAIACLLFLMEPLIATMAAVSLGVGVLAFDRLLRKRFVRYGTEDHLMTAEALRYLQQGLASSKEIRVLGCQDHFLDAYSTVRRKLASLRKWNATLTQFPRLAIETIMLGCMLLIILLVIDQERSSDDIMAAIGLFGIAAFRMMPSANRIVYSLNNIKFGQAALATVSKDIIDCRTFRWQPSEIFNEDLPHLRFEKQVELRDVAYKYPGNDRTVLKNINLTIRIGESIGLVGPSGAGKTTLADLILGLLIPTSGEMAVDGISLVEHQDAWRRRIGFVPQSISLIDDTLRRNIAFGLPLEAIDEERLFEVIRLARLEHVVETLPKGVDSRVGENGVRLSGGQRQRVGIARALYNNPDILVLDEATSSLDNETEREITKAIEDLSRERTLVVVAHRLSTVMGCDRLAFMKDGSIQDIGSFDELTDRNQDFRRMVQADRSPHDQAISADA